ncbi:LysM peptidoglycan-binding domain-containing protein [Paenibacillus sp. PK3_47]|uniref:LysM peptidoglycan-binding domain-containing protein n=1 Tax=Paenibacillus sp. PK3_47 TaxID=2072642 RepID=UPI00201DD2AA|nr:LysM peptidoglycan-binding domain-containing protein [Paenibacillus sp. PK3_47]
MFDQSHGLRFDIYERIHLSDELPGIAELEEVELIPEIQVIQREDRAELYGQLLLTGLYRGENDRTERLEHAIPVEITVPLTRVSSLDDIGVEIENFDIDLLTMRTVNITGVLSLRGIGGADSQPAWHQEEYTVAYSPEEEGQAKDITAEFREQENEVLYENSLWTFGEGAGEQQPEEQLHTVFAGEAVSPALPEDAEITESAGISSTVQREKEAKVQTHSINARPEGAGSGSAEPLTNHFFAAREKEEPAADPVPLQQAAAPLEIHVVHDEGPTLSADSSGPDTQPVQEDAAVFIDQGSADELFSAIDAAPPQEEKQDLKVALGSKKEEALSTKDPLTFSTLLGSSRLRKEPENLAEEDTAAAPAAPAAREAGNESEWKSRFIGGLGGKDLFRTVRLCIVQREETLDSIAEKYQLSARELVMYNRLSGQSVEEGQVLYIP